MPSATPVGDYGYFISSIALRLVKPSIKVSSLDTLALNVNAWQAGDHVRTIRSSGKLLSTTSVNTMGAEHFGKFEFTFNPFFSAVDFAHHALP